MADMTPVSPAESLNGSSVKEPAAVPEAVILQASFHLEEFRNLRTRVHQALGEQKNKIILVTSSVPREGKTTVAVNLAKAMGAVPWRTLLVDGDMRAHKVDAALGIEAGKGLSDLLEASRLIEGFIRRTDDPNMDVLTAGTPTDKPSEIINSAFMPFLMREMRARYHYVIIDSPPLVPVADALVMSGHVDGILLVVERCSTPRELVKGAVEQLQDRPLLGVVLNKVDRNPKYYYGYGYY